MLGFYSTVSISPMLWIDHAMFPFPNFYHGFAYSVRGQGINEVISQTIVCLVSLQELTGMQDSS